MAAQATPPTQPLITTEPSKETRTLDIAEEDNQNIDEQGEQQQLLGSGPHAHVDTDIKQKTGERWIEKFVRKIVYFFYFLTGQFAFVNTSTNKSLAIALYTSFTLVCIILNIFPFAITVADWFMCTSSDDHYNRYYNVCYSIILHPKANETNIPPLVLRDTLATENVPNADSLVDNKDNLTKFTIYARVMLLLTSCSSMISYIFFIVTFAKLFYFPHLDKTGLQRITKAARKAIDTLWCNKPDDDEKDLSPLHPFNDYENKGVDIEVGDNDNNTSTKLSEHNQAFSYYSILILNMIINFAMLIVFLCGQYAINPPAGDYPYNIIYIQILEILGVSCYIYSLFCTLFSCFIFSKLAYGIQNKYKSHNEVYLQHINKPADQLQDIHAYLHKIDGKDHTDDDELRVKLYYLQEKDKILSKVAKITIKQFEFWFLFHWILYIVSSFLSLSLFFEVIIYHTSSALPVQTQANEGIDFHPLEIAFLGLFSMSNCLFFLYPCIRAASITNSRQVQISELNRIYTNYDHVTPELKDRFAEFLKSQNAGFDLHILCARVPFGFSVAYISIFIALFSVLLKVVSSI